MVSSLTRREDGSASVCRAAAAAAAVNTSVRVFNYRFLVVVIELPASSCSSALYDVVRR